MNLLNWLLDHDVWAERVGWTLLHSLWQIAAIALLYAIAAMLLRHRSAGGRYLLGCTALLAMACGPLCTYAWLSQAQSPTPMPELAKQTLETPQPVVEETSESEPEFLVASDWEPVSNTHSEEADVELLPSNRVEIAPAATDLWASLRPWMPWATAIWLVGVMVLSFRPIWGWLHVRRLQRDGLSPLNDSLRQMSGRLMRQLGIHQAVRFAQSALVEVPTVVGYLRPMVLLPASAITGLSASELELIIAHELAHVRRHDYLVNLAQTVVESLLFYHPGMWWVSSQIRKERENCCDDVAVSLTGDRATYARALARLEEQRSATPATVLAATGGSLLDRVRRLLGKQEHKFGYRSATTWLAGLLTIGLVAAALAMNGLAPADAEDSQLGLSPLSTSQQTEVKRWIKKAGQPGQADFDASVDALVEIGPGVAPEMIPLLRHGSTDSLGRLVLEKLATDRAVQQVLVQAIKEARNDNLTGTNVIHCALLALGNCENREQVDFIALFLKTHYNPAMHALATLGGDQAREHLLQAFDVVPTNRWWMLAGQLRELGDPAAVPGLKKRLTQVKMPPSDQYPSITAIAIAEVIAKLSGEEVDYTTRVFGQGVHFKYPYDGPGRPKTFSVHPVKNHYVRLPKVDPNSPSGRAAIWKTMKEATEGAGFTIDDNEVVALNGLKIAPLWPTGPPYPVSLYDWLRRTSHQELRQVVEQRKQTGRCEIPKSGLLVSLDPSGRLCVLSMKRTAEPSVYSVTLMPQDPNLQLIPARENPNALRLTDLTNMTLHDLASEQPNGVLNLTRNHTLTLKESEWGKSADAILVAQFQSDEMALVVAKSTQFLMTEADDAWDDPAKVLTLLRKAAIEPSVVPGHRTVKERGDIFHAFSSSALQPGKKYVFAVKMPTGIPIAGIIEIKEVDWKSKTVQFRYQWLPTVAARKVFASNNTFEKATSTNMATISGRIVMEDGSPATVKGQMQYHSRKDRSSFAGTAGEYVDRFHCEVPPGKVWLWYFADGFSPAIVGPYDLAPGENKKVTITLKAGYRVPLRVVDAEGNPVPNAILTACPLVERLSAGSPYRGRMVFDNRGKFLLENVADFEYSMTVKAPGFEHLHLDSQKMVPDKVLTLSMIRSQPASGIVSNADGSPAAFAKLFLNRTVTIVNAHHSRSFSGGSLYGDLATTTDAQGRFVLDQLAQNSHYVFVVETIGEARLVVYDIKAGQQDIKITVPERRDLHVKVIGTISEQEQFRGSPTVYVSQRTEFHTSSDFSHSHRLGRNLPIETTAIGGTAIYRGLPANPTGNKGKQQVHVAINADVERKIVDINLNGATEVEFVLDEKKAKQPSAGDKITASKINLHLQDGSRVELTGDKKGVTLTRTPAPSLTVNARDKEGQPVVGAKVIVYDGNSFFTGQQAKFEQASGVTDALGTWVLDDLADHIPKEGSYRVCVYGPKQSGLSVRYAVLHKGKLLSKNPLIQVVKDVANNINVTFTLRKACPLDFHIVDATTGKWIHSAQVLYKYNRVGDWVPCSMQDSGERQENLTTIVPEMSDADFLAIREGYYPQQFKLDESLSPEKEVTKRIELQPAPLIELTVLDAEGKPAAGAKLEYLGPDSRHAYWPIKPADGAGRISLKYPELGELARYRVTHDRGTALFTAKNLPAPVWQASETPDTATLTNGPGWALIRKEIRLGKSVAEPLPTVSDKTSQSNDFFPPDPYPGLGFRDIHHGGWHFMRVASFSPASADLGISRNQQQTINTLYREYVEKSRKLDPKAQQEQQPGKWTQKQFELGQEGRQAAEKLLTPAQVQRIAQVMVLRQGSRVFFQQQVRNYFRLSQKQIGQIQAAMNAHAKRQGRPDSPTAIASGEGYKSYQQLGNEIKQILNAKQRSLFDQLRGISRPENRVAIQVFVKTIAPLLPAGWSVAANDHQVTLQRQKKVLMVGLYGRPGMNPSETEEEYLQRIGGEYKESGTIRGKIIAPDNHDKRVKYSITLEDGALRKLREKRKQQQPDIRHLGPRSPGVVVSAGETFEFTNVPLGKCTVTAIAMIQEQKKILGKSVKIELSIKPRQTTNIGFSFSPPQESKGWVDSVETTPIGKIGDRRIEKAKWSKAVDGVQARLIPKQAKWPEGTPPEFEIELRSDKERGVSLPRSTLQLDVEVDGSWYQSRSSRLPMGYVLSSVTAKPVRPFHKPLLLDGNWGRDWKSVQKSGTFTSSAENLIAKHPLLKSLLIAKHPLPQALTPGKHTIRVKIIGELVTQPVEIEIVATEKEEAAKESRLVLSKIQGEKYSPEAVTYTLNGKRIKFEQLKERLQEKHTASSKFKLAIIANPGVSEAMLERAEAAVMGVKGLSEVQTTWHAAKPGSPATIEKQQSAQLLSESQPLSEKTYTDPKHGVSLKIPVGWSQDKEEAPISHATSLSFTPDKIPSPGVRPSLRVTVDDLGKGNTATQNTAVKRNPDATAWKVLEIDGQPALLTSFVPRGIRKEDPLAYEMLRVQTAKGSKFYAVHLTFPQKQHDEYVRLALAICKSVRFNVGPISVTDIKAHLDGGTVSFLLDDRQVKPKAIRVNFDYREVRPIEKRGWKIAGNLTLGRLFVGADSPDKQGAKVIGLGSDQEKRILRSLNLWLDLKLPSDIQSQMLAPVRNSRFFKRLSELTGQKPEELRNLAALLRCVRTYERVFVRSHGVNVRLSGDPQKQWQVDEVPTYQIAVTNWGELDSLLVFRNASAFELEFDGKWYRWTGHSGGRSSPLPPGRIYDAFLLPLENNWQHQGKPIQLSPGKHLIRVRYRAHPFPSNPDNFLAISNLMPVWIAKKVATPKKAINTDQAVLDILNASKEHLRTMPDSQRLSALARFIDHTRLQACSLETDDKEASVLLAVGGPEQADPGSANNDILWHLLLIKQKEQWQVTHVKTIATIAQCNRAHSPFVKTHPRETRWGYGQAFPKAILERLLKTAHEDYRKLLGDWELVGIESTVKDFASPIPNITSHSKPGDRFILPAFNTNFGTIFASGRDREDVIRIFGIGGDPTLFPEKSPKEIRFGSWSSSISTFHQGIYRFEPNGDVTICLNSNSPTAPKEFTINANKQQLLLRIRRSKAKPLLPTDLEARERFLAVEQMARLPMPKQAKQLTPFYNNLNARSISPLAEEILSTYPHDILASEKQGPFDGNTAQWEQQIAEAANKLNADQVADKLKTRLWLDIATRARTLQIFKKHPDATTVLIQADLISGNKRAVEQACRLIAELQWRTFSQQLLSLVLAENNTSEIAKRALLAVSDPAMTQQLLTLIEKDPKVLIRIHTLLYSPLHGEPAPALLLKLIDSPDAKIRYSAAHAMYGCRDARLAQPAVRLSQEKDRATRWLAAQLASNLPPESFKQVRSDLLHLLTDENESVRFHAIRCFSLQKDLAVGPILLELLQRKQMDENYKVTLMQSLKSLCKTHWNYNMHAWGPKTPENQRAITQFKTWLLDAQNPEITGEASVRHR